MQNRFGLLVVDVMPMFMIMPRYSHNNALFYQLLDSNLFTHHNTFVISREATSETYGPRGLFLIILHLFYYRISFTILQYLLSNLYNKIPKIFILLSLSDLTFASGREGIDNPFIALGASV